MQIRSVKTIKLKTLDYGLQLAEMLLDKHPQPHSDMELENLILKISINFSSLSILY